jgi:hypothetical protein
MTILHIKYHKPPIKNWFPCEHCWRRRQSSMKGNWVRIGSWRSPKMMKYPKYWRNTLQLMKSIDNRSNRITNMSRSWRTNYYRDRKCMKLNFLTKLKGPKLPRIKKRNKWLTKSFNSITKLPDFNSFGIKRF